MGEVKEYGWLTYKRFVIVVISNLPVYLKKICVRRNRRILKTGTPNLTDKINLGYEPNFFPFL